MLRYNINGKILALVQDMYKNAKSYVRSNAERSDFFECNVGVRQGDNLSPLLFAMFINDFELTLRENCKGVNLLPCNIDKKVRDEGVNVCLKLFTLLYADDTVIFAESENDLQIALNNVNKYCKKWSLKVNINKTKVVIFSRGKIRKLPVFRFGNDILEIVDDYVYLGTTFNYNHHFKKAQNKQIIQARKAMFSLRAKSKSLNLPIDIELDLFEKLVNPILLYGSEVWGCEENLKEIEHFQISYYKQLLKINKRSANCMAFGELGKHSIFKNIEMRMLLFWIRIVTSKTSKLSHIVYDITKSLFDLDIYRSSWIVKIKNSIDKLGLSYLWDTIGSKDAKWLELIIKQRLDDVYSQNWHYEVNHNSHCLNYRIFK